MQNLGYKMTGSLNEGANVDLGSLAENTKEMGLAKVRYNPTRLLIHHIQNPHHQMGVLALPCGLFLLFCS
jgi:hypothetical protein